MNKLDVFLRFLILASLSIMLAFPLLGLYINLSHSLPRGIYQKINKKQIAKGDLVLFCLDQETATLAQERKYISSTFIFHRCPQHLMPLLKPVVAVPGDEVEVDEMVKVNGELIPNSALLPLDTHQRILPRARSGVLMPERYFVLSSHSNQSFDGRYFGTIQRSQIIGVLKAWWVNEPPKGQ